MTRKQRDFRVKLLSVIKKGVLIACVLLMAIAFLYQAQVDADFVIESQSYDCKAGYCEVTIVAAATKNATIPIDVRVTGVKVKWIGDAQINKQLFSEVFSEELAGKTSQTVQFRFKIPSLDKPDYLLITLKQSQA
ncbi:hypothetical protein [Pseudoalteromonas luteoviolacea]|nr:hypothetical protein [Pseudoalteromonas luteoviolacea]